MYRTIYYENGECKMKDKLVLLTDITLGHLMRIVYNKDSSKTFLMRLKKGEAKSGDTIFSSLKAINENGIFKEGYLFDLNTRFTSKALSSLMIVKSDFIRKRNASLVVGVGSFHFSSLAEDIKKTELLVSKFKSKIGEFLKNNDLLVLREYQSVFDELEDEVRISMDQMERLKIFLGNYIDQYKDRKLINQDGLKKPDYLVNTLRQRLSLSKWWEEYDGRDVPINGLIWDNFCHGLLYLNLCGGLILKKLFFELKKRTYYWKAVVDLNRSIYRKDRVDEQDIKNFLKEVWGISIK